MIDMVQFAAQPSTFSKPRKPQPDYTCGECGSTDLDKDDILICNGCGKQAEFSSKVCGGWDDEDRYSEWEESTCHRCGFKSVYAEDVVQEPMAWYCRACGHVGEPRDLDQERWEREAGL